MNEKTINFDNLTRNHVAQAFDVSARTVSNWLEAGCPRKPNGRYCLKDVIQWKIDELEAEVANVDSPALERYRTARAELAELELEERRGQLAPVEQVLKAWCNRVAIVTSGLEVLADRLAVLLEGKTAVERRKIIRDEVRFLRNSYAKPDGKYCPTPAEEEGENGA